MSIIQGQIKFLVQRIYLPLLAFLEVILRMKNFGAIEDILCEGRFGARHLGIVNFKESP
ncbi:MAG: hypothetical protein WCF20_12360 [Methylovirgula sp.]